VYVECVKKTLQICWGGRIHHQQTECSFLG
jgi:hypothetical protein